MLLIHLCASSGSRLDRFFCDAFFLLACLCFLGLGFLRWSFHCPKVASWFFLCFSVWPPAAHVRSLHFHNTENLGFSSTFYTIQQDFLFDPGSYRRTGEATVIPEAEGWSSVKHAMAALLRALQNEGWHAVLEYKADCPFDREAMPDLLIPSK